MKRGVLERILHRAAKLKIMVIGDFFLDHYLFIDPSKEERSIETGKAAHQVTRIRATPGAAGNVANNLSTLGVQEILAVGLLGSDGYGYQLKESLNAQGVDTTNMLVSLARITPTYIKPMRGKDGQEEELDRLDLKNWTPTPAKLEAQLLDILENRGPNCDAIVVVDQVEEADCGVVTKNVRAALTELGREHPDLIISVDSRKHIDQFSQVIIKPNEFEAGKVLGVGSAADEPEQAVKALFCKTGKPVFMTCGEKGQWVYDGDQALHEPALQVKGPIDIVGAGDSASAGTVVALAAGASYQDAAFMGNLVSSVTITQLGTTGAASPQDVLERYDEWKSGY